VAPEHAETQRALVPLASNDDGRRAGLGWGALALAVILTWVDWIRRARRPAALATLEVRGEG
jgi:hypothetical protein